MFTDISFGRRSEDHFRQFLGFFQSSRQFNAANGSGLLVIFPASTDDIAANDRFYRNSLVFFDDNCASSDLIALMRSDKRFGSISVM